MFSLSFFSKKFNPHQKYIPISWRIAISDTSTFFSVKLRGTHLDSTSKDSQIISGLYSEKWDRYLTESLISSINSFCNRGLILDAFKAFSLLQRYDSSFFSQAICSLLSSCSKNKAFLQGKQLHGLVISLGFEQTPLLVPKLVTFYANIGNFSDAHCVTKNAGFLHPLPWNLLISAYVRDGYSIEAIYAYKQMMKVGVKADNFTYPSILKACGDEFDIKMGMSVHKDIEQSDLEWCLFVQNALISMYSKCGLITMARKLFDEMPQRDIISWNTIISGYASKDMWKEAFDLFEQMPMMNEKADIATWNTIASGNLKTGNPFGALKVITEMRIQGTKPDVISLSIGLSACSKVRSIKHGKEIHGFSIRSLLDGAENVINALITMYSRCRDLLHSYILFRTSEIKTLVSWNSIIAGFCHLDRSEEASFLFREMISSMIEPNYVTLASILPLCARIANLQHGKELHCYILKRRFENYLLLWNSLVDMYSKSGKILDAQKVFDLMHMKDEVSYTILMAGYGIQGQGLTALRLFNQMIKSNIKPDHITMVAALSACSHSGIVDQGQFLFDKMVSHYNIIPRVEHYACMVDLFGRAGLLRKAEEIIMRMPFKPCSAMWATLLGCCQIHRNLEIGERAADKLLEMQPENPGYYVLIANMHASVGNWGKLATVRTIMRDLGFRKTPGCAWVDMGNGFYPFTVDDKSNPSSQGIYMVLDGLIKNMKEAGYIVDECFGLEEFG